MIPQEILGRAKMSNLFEVRLVRLVCRASSSLGALETHCACPAHCSRLTHMPFAAGHPGHHRSGQRHRSRALQREWARALCMLRLPMSVLGAPQSCDRLSLQGLSGADLGLHSRDLSLFTTDSRLSPQRATIAVRPVQAVVDSRKGGTGFQRGACSHCQPVGSRQPAFLRCMGVLTLVMC
jgi:hypothetical protein